jgi:hypothetical protein
MEPVYVTVLIAAGLLLLAIAYVFRLCSSRSAEPKLELMVSWLQYLSD